MKKSFLFLAIFIFLLASTVAAEDPYQIIVNSADWRDVYSAMVYSQIIKVTPNFLVSDRHGPLILNSIPKENHIWALSSKSVPYIVGYEGIISGKGYSVEEFTYDNMNLELAEDLPDVNNFIVIDDSYGYNAIAVAPYARITDAYVFFADATNIDDVDDILADRTINELIIFGHVDREVRDTLAKYGPEIINEGGDRFSNNVEIVKKYQAKSDGKQVILTNGEFIEKEIMSGKEPVLFIGSNNVPDQIGNYIRGSNIEVGVLIGNELVGTATFIRRQVGISVFVKFAQGSRAPQGSISQVEALDMFYLPVYTLNLELDSIQYNQATNKLEVTVRNTEEQAIYFKGTYTLNEEGGVTQSVGDDAAVFIDGNSLKTVTYDVEQMADGKIAADIFIIYGESSGSMEKEIRGKAVFVETVKILDNAEIQINSVEYKNKFFYVEIENIGDVKTYVDLEVIDVLIAGEPFTYGLAKVSDLDVGEIKKLRVKADPELEDEDFEDNELVKIKAYYGERENSLIKILQAELPLEVVKFGAADIAVYGLAVLIILLIILIIWRFFFAAKKKKKKKD
ncbi:MAG: hypothetical protein GY861_27105 [bacterium]|nr:hypothetical protein [bacterium]